MAQILKKQPWSSGYGRRLMFPRSWVQFPAPYTGRTLHVFTLIFCKKYNDICLKRPIINEKEVGVGSFLMI